MSESNWPEAVTVRKTKLGTLALALIWCFVSLIIDLSNHHSFSWFSSSGAVLVIAAIRIEYLVTKQMLYNKIGVYDLHYFERGELEDLAREKLQYEKLTRKRSTADCNSGQRERQEIVARIKESITIASDSSNGGIPLYAAAHPLVQVMDEGMSETAGRVALFCAVAGTVIWAYGEVLVSLFQ